MPLEVFRSLEGPLAERASHGRLLDHNPRIRGGRRSYQAGIESSLRAPTWALQRGRCELILRKDQNKRADIQFAHKTEEKTKAFPQPLKVWNVGRGLAPYSRGTWVSWLDLVRPGPTKFENEANTAIILCNLYEYQDWLPAIIDEDAIATRVHARHETQKADLKDCHCTYFFLASSMLGIKWLLKLPS